jgi:hypothetical protein
MASVRAGAEKFLFMPLRERWALIFRRYFRLTAFFGPPLAACVRQGRLPHLGQASWRGETPSETEMQSVVQGVPTAAFSQLCGRILTSIVTSLRPRANSSA